ncbi:MAG TPA: hypothetical protein VMU65_11350 [Candidatus Saccharimonadales bacterium]|nr:hypothetical protein [Candidatus Saccharimonadales bacterium]
MLGNQSRVLGLVCAAIGAAVLGGCSASSSTNTTNGNTIAGSSSAGSGQSVTFNVQVNFTGTDAIQGSFADHETGSGFHSCAQYASVNTPLGWLGPAPPTQATTQIGGKTVSWLMGVPKANFHGSGSYSGSVISDLAIGSDDFTGSNSQVMLNSDGSGSASFTSLSAFTSSAVDSGTITWTCSG